MREFFYFLLGVGFLVWGQVSSWDSVDFFAVYAGLVLFRLPWVSAGVLIGVQAILWSPLSGGFVNWLLVLVIIYGFIFFLLRGHRREKTLALALFHLNLFLLLKWVFLNRVYGLGTLIFSSLVYGSFWYLLPKLEYFISQYARRLRITSVDEFNWQKPDVRRKSRNPFGLKK